MTEERNIKYRQYDECLYFSYTPENKVLSWGATEQVNHHFRPNSPSLTEEAWIINNGEVYFA